MGHYECKKCAQHYDLCRCNESPAGVSEPFKLDIARLRNTLKTGDEYTHKVWCRLYGEGVIVSVNVLAEVFIVSYGDENNSIRITYNKFCKPFEGLRAEFVQRTLFFNSDYTQEHPSYPWNPVLNPDELIVVFRKESEEEKEITGRIRGVYRVVQDTESEIECCFYSNLDRCFKTRVFLKDEHVFYKLTGLPVSWK